MRRRDPHQPVAEEPPGGRRWPPPAGPCPDRCAPAGPAPRSAARSASASIRCSPTSWFILAASSPTVSAVRKSTPQSRKACTSGRGPGPQPPGQQPEVLAGQVAVLLRAGQAELLGRMSRCRARTRSSRDPLAVMCRSAPSASKPGNSGAGSRRPRASSHSDDGPGRIRMPWWLHSGRVVDDALRVVPHPVGVDHPAAGPRRPPRSSTRRRNPAPRRSSSPAARPTRGASSAGPARGSRRCPRWRTTTAWAENANSPTTSVGLRHPARRVAEAPARSRAPVRRPSPTSQPGDLVPVADAGPGGTSAPRRRTARPCPDRYPR